METDLTNRWTIHRVTGDEIEQTEDVIVNETPVTLVINGEEFATVVCSPVQLEELIIGFLAAEGVIRSFREIQKLSVNTSQGFVNIEIQNFQKAETADMTKRVIGSCCGKSRQFYFKNDVKTARTIMRAPTATIEQCMNLMNGLKQTSDTFDQTGGVHNAALCLPDQIVETATDIGRHNTLDKLYGHMLQNNLRGHDYLVAFSGRISSEVILKVSKMGIGILLSKSAPTDLALKLADDLNITAAGFIRNQKMNIYTHPERLIRQL